MFILPEGGHARKLPEKWLRLSQRECSNYVTFDAIAHRRASDFCPPPLEGSVTMDLRSVDLHVAEDQRRCAFSYLIGLRRLEMPTA